MQLYGRHCFNGVQGWSIFAQSQLGMQSKFPLYFQFRWLGLAQIGKYFLRDSVSAWYNKASSKKKKHLLATFKKKAMQIYNKGVITIRESASHL